MYAMTEQPNLYVFMYTIWTPVDRFPDMTIAEADDGEDVVRMVREKMGRGESFDFILMDNIMVLYIACSTP